MLQTLEARLALACAGELGQIDFLRCSATGRSPAANPRPSAAGFAGPVWTTAHPRKDDMCWGPPRLRRSMIWVQGSPRLRWAVFEVTKCAARPCSPDYTYYHRLSYRADGNKPGKFNRDHGSRSPRSNLKSAGARLATATIGLRRRVRNSTVIAGSAYWASALKADGL
jgi:hypothetical protein